MLTGGFIQWDLLFTVIAYPVSHRKGLLVPSIVAIVAPGESNGCENIGMHFHSRLKIGVPWKSTPFWYWVHIVPKGHDYG